MANGQRPIRVRDDLASVPLPPAQFWTRARGRPRLAPRVAILLATALAVAVISLPIADQLAQRRDGPASGIATPSPIPSPSEVTVSQAPAVPYAPGTNAIGGRLVRHLGSSLVIDTVEYGEVTVDLSRVIDVWKETSVPASSLEPGDDLWIDGAAATSFVALHVYANIGRMDGVVRAIDATGLLVEVASRAGGNSLQRIDFSPYIEYGTPDAPLSRTDLVVGRQIGAVLYRPPGATPRATRIWW